MNICEISYHIMDRNSFDYLEGLLEQLNKKRSDKNIFQLVSVTKTQAKTSHKDQSSQTDTVLDNVNGESQI